MPVFKAGVHDEMRKCKPDTRHRCLDVFHCLVKEGEYISYGEKRSLSKVSTCISSSVREWSKVWKDFFPWLLSAKRSFATPGKAAGESSGQDRRRSVDLSEVLARLKGPRLAAMPLLTKRLRDSFVPRWRRASPPKRAGHRRGLFLADNYRPDWRR